MNNDQDNLLTEIKYAGFWKRLAAQLIDFSFFYSLIITASLYFYNNKMAQYVLTITSLVLTLFYEVYLVQKYGGTPGKKIMKLEIRKLDLSRVSYKEAFLRNSVIFFLSLLQSIIFFIGLASLSTAEMLNVNLNFNDLSKTYNQIMPPLYTQTSYVAIAWRWTEFIVIIFNRKKRSLDDYIAGTVVIETPQKAN